jgi:hypothetical protein
MSDLSDAQEALLELGAEYIKAHGDLLLCRRSTVYDASYFCSDYQRKRDEAATAMFTALDAYINATCSKSA